MLNLLYSNLTGDFVATANAGTKTITFSSYASTVLSSVISSKSFLGASIKRRSSAGAVDTLPVTNVSFSANVLTLSGMSANFASGDEVVVVLIGPDKAFDQANDASLTTLLTKIAGERLLLDVLLTQDKPVIDPEVSRTPFNAAADADYSVKTTIGQIYSVWAVNRGSSLLWIQIHNKATAPSGGDTAAIWHPLPPGNSTVPGYGLVDKRILGSGGYHCTIGIAIGISTAKTTFTAATPADVDLGGTYL